VLLRLDSRSLDCLSSLKTNNINEILITFRDEVGPLSARVSLFEVGRISLLCLIGPLQVCETTLVIDFSLGQTYNSVSVIKLNARKF